MGKKFDVGMEGSKLAFGLDLNEDGESSISLKLNLPEALQEAISRGEAVEGAKVADFHFEGSKLVLKLDTDKDGEELLDLVLDLGEAFDEGTSLIAQKG